MKEFLSLYGGTIIISAILLAICFFSIKRIIKNRKTGKCSCGCEECALKDNCHKEK